MIALVVVVLAIALVPVVLGLRGRVMRTQEIFFNGERRTARVLEDVQS